MSGPESPRLAGVATPQADRLLEVRQLDESARRRWDRFVVATPEATFCHLSGWARVIEAAYGHRTYSLYTQENGHITGILPLAHVRSRVFGNALVSFPFCVYGGIVARNPAARGRLETAACELAEGLRADYLELRNLRPQRADWISKPLYVTFRKPIDPDPERNLSALRSRQRYMIRKGIQRGLTANVEDSIEPFYSVYSESMRDHGTPVFSKRYFELLQAEFDEDCEIVAVRRGERVVSCVMSFYFRDEVLLYYAGGTKEARRLAGNDVVCWEVMRRACEKGVRVFDFGRSRVGSGSFHFKRHWGFEPQPLSYEYYLVRAAGMPDVSPANPRLRFCIECWKRLPLPLSRRIGPFLARNLG